MSPHTIVDHLPGLRRYARALTGDVWAADDLVQDTLERACSRWRLWLAGSDLRAWLLTLMHNLFISQVRQGQLRAKLVTAVNLDDVAHELLAPDCDKAASIDLQRCLMRLPEDQREVLLLVALEDLTYSQVAKITATPIGTVMSRLSRARVRLRALMDEPAHPASGASTMTASRSSPVLKRMK